MTTKKPPTTNSTRDHAAIAHKYALDVIAGKVPAGIWVKAACQRHINDLKRRSKYRFEQDKGARVCRFIELLPHTKGKWAAAHELIKLEPWQCFLVVVGFGWINRETGKRRFRRFYWEIPRKNGKSLLAAAIGLYMLGADGEYGAEVYSGATSEKQAHEVWKPAKIMLQRSKKMCDTIRVEVCAKTLVRLHDASKFEPVIGNPGDGSSPSCAIIDEFHEHDTPNLYDTMQTGMGAREQPLMLVITTAGTNIAGPCHEMHEEVRKVLEGTIENDEVFACIFGIDPEDDWADPKSLIKANPNFGVSVDAEFLLSQQRQALQNPIQQSRFRTKHMNVWTSVMSGVMNMQQWMLCADKDLEESDVVGAECWIAADLASKSDLCAEQRLYRRELNGRYHYYLFGRYWLPEETIEEPGPNSAHYRKWVNQGFLVPTDGATVDFDLITEQIVADCKYSNPNEVVFDPFNAVAMMQKVQAHNIEVVEFIQQPHNFVVPLDELVSAVKDGRFHHDGNPITAWCMSNMVARPSKKGMVSPIKQKPHQKIDGAIAVIMAMGRAAAIVEAAPDYQAFFVGAETADEK